MSKRYWTSRNMFSSNWDVVEATALVIRARSSKILSTFGWNTGSFTQPQKKKIQFNYIREARWPRDWSILSNSSVWIVLFTDYLTVRPQCREGIIVLIEDVWLSCDICRAAINSRILTSFVQFMVLKEEWSHHLMTRKGATHIQLGPEILPTIRLLNGLSSRCVFSIFPMVTTSLHLNKWFCQPVPQLRHYHLLEGWAVTAYNLCGAMRSG
jgi:hypothetical protein